MNTEELKSIGLNEEQIAEVFKLRGKEIQQAKNDYDLLKTENESLKESLNTANEKIEMFKDVDVESIKSEVDKYKDMYEKNTWHYKRHGVQYRYKLYKEESTMKDKKIRIKQVKIKITILILTIEITSE
ncbi:MAG: phage scaffolding protein [Tissierellia bacterium]|nr:phage scaffolding protein [Tissierellia bacterium]